MQEYNILIRNGQFESAKKNCKLLFSHKYINKNRDVLTLRSQGIRGYAEACIYQFIDNSDWNEIRDALNELDKFLNNYSNTIGGYFSTIPLNRLRVFCNLMLGNTETAQEIVKNNFPEHKQISLLKIIEEKHDPYLIINYIKNPFH